MPINQINKVKRSFIIKQKTITAINDHLLLIAYACAKRHTHRTFTSNIRINQVDTIEFGEAFTRSLKANGGDICKVTNIEMPGLPFFGDYFYGLGIMIPGTQKAELYINKFSINEKQVSFTRNLRLMSLTILE